MEKKTETFAEAMGDGYKVENGVVVPPGSKVDMKDGKITVEQLAKADPNQVIMPASAGVVVDPNPIGQKTSDGALDANERTIQAEGSNAPAAAPAPAAPEQQTTAVAKQKEKAVVLLNQQGLPVPSDFDAAFRVAHAMHQGGAFPKWVKNAMQALAVSQFCRSLNLDPMTGVQHVCEINGRLALWGEGPLAAVRASGKLKSIKEVFVTKDYVEISLENKNLDAELFACVCTLVRENGEVVQRYFTAEDEKKAMKGLPDVWKGYRRVMFKRKARAEAIKDLFGDVVCGAGIAEWDFNTAPDVTLETERKTLAERVSERVGT